MKVGWEVRPLGDFIELISGQHIDAVDYNIDGHGVGYITGPSDFGRDEPLISKWTEKPKRFADPGDILLTVKGSGVGKINRLRRGRVAISRQIMAVRAKGIDADFLHLLLGAHGAHFASLANGAAIPGISREHVTNLQIPLPPMDEQTRIVAILDEAFAGLSRARANAEANLADARKLLEVTIAERLKSGNGDWQQCLVENSYRRTKIPSKVQCKDYLSEGRYPIVSQEADFISGYWEDDADLVRVERPIVVFGDHTRHLKYIDFDFVVGADGTQLLAPISQIEPKFYYYALRSIPLAGKGYARHFSHLKKETIWFPADLASQRAIADTLEEIEVHIADLARAYIAQSGSINSLRQSLLQKAFSGELT
ncbi:restriction modification system DNA specificity domain protein [Rhodomicrobium vannielii ATCC 17100]|uniref:Restriction modification system DNA specificity domain protein n=1 Tax=Rhodomicrobium vannielii (strain ATCC 17100 / DSM 162 / LMG 4299 / NCIMB 10020 / ATH 3.1.1) TaxID=648757 RepID=E3I121_RHOVT|nr:restriction endonuclease subunit S [Rhodomicrobium vannielii]ADP72344.1 restriction modification system DNA specificity domain protein [Rhodomicrobium vannielii ATCC 17100]